MDTTALVKKGFLVTEHGEYRLVHPARNKFDWDDSELTLRSVVLDRSGRIVSTGWPKFFNQGERPETDSVIAGELSEGRAVITHKHDGSLIIRSVLPDGTVLFRTRGSFDGGEYGVNAHAVASAKYPALLDPAVYPHGSLLFEYVGSDNQIVVRYEADDLIFLGAAEHGPPVRYADWAELERLAESLQLKLVETYDWAGAQGVEEILKLVQDWSHSEGVVVRSGDGQTLLKLKSAWYFAQHALRWHLSYDSMVRFILDGGITEEDGLVAALTQAGWDWELQQTAKEHFGVYAARRAEADALTAAAYALAAQYPSEGFADERARRKAFAEKVMADAGELRRYAFLAYDNKKAGLEAALLRNVIMGRPRSGS
ncbi:MAG: RNA ligase [Armatimonas sp.]